MAEARLRFAEFERGQIDMETGEFPMILATDGEASDGDILSIEGAQFTSRAPLQISHINDPRDTLGTVSGFRRDLQSSPKKLRARGQIEMTGDGPTAEIRRDIANMIQQGHVTGISVRWQPQKYTRRVDLPKDHPAHVKQDEPNWMKRNGFFHEKWQVLEGSVVAIQADKEAMVGRAEQTEGHVSAFWRAMAADAVATNVVAEDAKRFAAKYLEAHEQNVEVAPPPAEYPEGAIPRFVLGVVELDDAAKLAIAAARLRELKAELGLSTEALSAELDAQRAKEAPTSDELLALIESQSVELAAMRTQLASLEVSRVNGAPTPLRNVAQIVNHLECMLDQSVQRALATAEMIIDSKVGKINPKLQSYRQVAHAEADELIRRTLGAKAPDPHVEVVAGMLTRMESMLEAARKKIAPPPEK